jgi:hypothetical protein
MNIIIHCGVLPVLGFVVSSYMMFLFHQRCQKTTSIVAILPIVILKDWNVEEEYESYRRRSYDFSSQGRFKPGREFGPVKYGKCYSSKDKFKMFMERCVGREIY